MLGVAETTSVSLKFHLNSLLCVKHSKYVLGLGEGSRFSLEKAKKDSNSSR